MEDLLQTIEDYIRRIDEASKRFNICDEHPEFYKQMNNYIDALHVEGVCEENKEDVLGALLETHTLILMDEDLDGLGLQRLDDVWQWYMVFKD